MYRLRQRVESRVALSKPVARYTGSLYLRIMYRFRQRVNSRVALTKPVARYTRSLPQDNVPAQAVARYMGVDQTPITSTVQTF
jgi:hypothetical protein